MAIDETIKRYLDLATNDKSKSLDINFDGKVLEPGQYIARSEASIPPTISFPSLPPSATYMVVCIDLDGPFPSFNILSPILHWIQPGFKSSPSTKVLISNAPFVADYVGPGPPPGSSPHRYLFLLYKQPAAFDGKEHAPADGKPYGNMTRMRFGLSDWEKKVNLKSPVAVNYFISN